MSKVKLNYDQLKLKDSLISMFRSISQNKDIELLLGSDLYENLIESMAIAGDTLNSSLNVPASNYESITSCVDLSPDDVDFFKNPLAIQSLINYISSLELDNSTCRSDNHNFNMNIYSRRLDYELKIKIMKTQNGWEITSPEPSESFSIEKDGSPYLHKILNVCFINYPHDIGGYLEWLWYQANDKNLDPKRVEYEFDNLSRWITICDEYTPGGIFGEYK